MGIDFRGGDYVRRVRFGKRTVKAGEAVAVWDSYGRHTEVVGPALLRLYFSTIRFLDRHVAGDKEFLRVRHIGGTIEHIRGPVSMFENPVYHIKIDVEPAISLEDDSQHIVVRRGQKTGGEFAAREEILTGPSLVFPEATDQVRTLRWTEEGAGALLQKGRVISTRATIVRQVACDVQGSDDHFAKVTVTLRAQLVSVHQALAIFDPVAECDAVAREAVSTTCSSIKFGDLDISLSASLGLGFSAARTVTWVNDALSFRAACKLVSLSLHSIELSEKLKELRNQADALAAAKLKEKVLDHALEAAAAREEREHQLQASKQRHALQLELERDNAARARMEKVAVMRVAFLRSLGGIGVDVTRYVCQEVASGQKGISESTNNAKDNASDGNAYGRILG